MSNPTKAVFLSYASQDAEPAKRIADALRAADIEVWFDQSELRGGDAWDRKIREQIKECALFVPILSDIPSFFPMIRDVPRSELTSFHCRRVRRHLWATRL